MRFVRMLASDYCCRFVNFRVQSFSECIWRTIQRYSRRFEYRSRDRLLPVYHSDTLHKSNVVHACLELNFNRQIGDIWHFEYTAPYRRHAEYSYWALSTADDTKRYFIGLKYISSRESSSSSRISQNTSSTPSFDVTPPRGYYLCNRWHFHLESCSKIGRS